jgi:hypothetical protein
MEKAEVRDRLTALAATAEAGGFTIDWAKLLQAIMLFIEAIKPKPPVPGPVVVSAEDFLEAVYAEVEAGKINWDKIFAFIEKILPLILPLFV